MANRRRDCASFAVERDQFVVFRDEDEIRVIVGYPTGEILARCQFARGGAPLLGAPDFEADAVDSDGPGGASASRMWPDPSHDQITPGPRAGTHDDPPEEG